MNEGTDVRNTSRAIKRREARPGQTIFKVHEVRREHPCCWRQIIIGSCDQVTYFLQRTSCQHVLVHSLMLSPNVCIPPATKVPVYVFFSRHGCHTYVRCRTRLVLPYCSVFRRHAGVYARCNANHTPRGTVAGGLIYLALIPMQLRIILGNSVLRC